MSLLSTQAHLIKRSFSSCWHGFMQSCKRGGGSYPKDGKSSTNSRFPIYEVEQTLFSKEQGMGSFHNGRTFTGCWRMQYMEVVLIVVMTCRSEPEVKFFSRFSVGLNTCLCSKCDIQILKAFLREFFCPAVVGVSGKPKRLLGTRIVVPADAARKDYLQLIHSLPENDSPALFGLPANIDRSVQEKKSRMLTSKLKLLGTSEVGKRRTDSQAGLNIA